MFLLIILPFHLVNEMNHHPLRTYILIYNISQQNKKGKLIRNLLFCLDDISYYVFLFKVKLKHLYVYLYKEKKILTFSVKYLLFFAQIKNNVSTPFQGHDDTKIYFYIFIYLFFLRYVIGKSENGFLKFVVGDTLQKSGKIRNRLIYNILTYELNERKTRRVKIKEHEIS